MDITCSIKFISRTLFVALLCSQASRAFQCNEGISKWFLPFGENIGDQVELPNNQKFQICHPFRALGIHYADGFRVSVRGGDSAGTLRVYPRSGYKSEGAFELRASKAKYEETAIGLAHMRVSENPTDLERAARIINEAYPCLERGSFYPTVAFVATFTCLKHRKRDQDRDTFQVVLAISSDKIYLVLNYHTLNDAGGLQFALIDRATKSKTLFTNVKRKQMVPELLESTNGIRKGVWVFDITNEAVAPRPEPCPKMENECTMTNFGSIHGFEDNFLVSPSNLRRYLSTSTFEPSHECNIRSRVRMTGRGEVRYVDFSVGPYDETNIERSMVQFDFGRKEGIVRKRGGGRLRANTLDLTSTFSVSLGESNIVTIVKTDAGWILENKFCGYRMEFRPHSPEPDYRLTVGQIYVGNLDGFCGDYDGALDMEDMED